MVVVLRSRISRCLDPERQGQIRAADWNDLSLSENRAPQNPMVYHHSEQYCKEIAILDHVGVYRCTPCSDRPNIWTN